MADKLYEAPSGVIRKFRDMGDGTWAEVVSTDGGSGGSSSAALTRTALLSAVTSTGAGSAAADAGTPPSFTAAVAGTGAVSATVLIQARNTASGQWITLGTITLSGTTSAADGFASLARYMEYRANLTAITGTSAAVTVDMGS